ncbi:substrate-binding domain-containing protein [uncultured Allobaculum sp.]|uniref:substrate-binding domain-containing protein n=2 Tax=Allobaculum TaxID=174708 RepID=UPI0025825E89|nr:substrate-binding domain-containing protein [uncultured Allobaculum sp.]
MKRGKTMKTTFKSILTAAAAAAALNLAACSSNSTGSNASSGGSSTQNTPAAIAVLTREDGSGTRGAFTELFKLEENGEDLTRADAEVTNSTAVMLTTVAQNPSAIGYISLGSLNDSVKAVSIDGVVPSVDTVIDGTYTVSRPFLVVQKEGSDNPLAADFEKFLLSEDGQAVISEAGYVPVEADGVYTAAGMSGEMTVGGSSSVTPVMEKLAEAYQSLNPDAQIAVMQTDSTTGASSTAEGVYDLGMLSRELKPEEESQGLKSIVIARDGIAVIVNPSNTVDSLSADQVKEVYSGKIEDWSALESK